VIVGFDLDSTLCDTTHRHHMIDRENGTDWEAYSMACSDDSPGPAYWLAATLAEAGAKLVICSMRNSCALEKTEAWLADAPFVGSIVRISLYDKTEDDAYARDMQSHDRAKAGAVERLNDWCIENHGEAMKLFVDDWPGVKTEVEALTGIPTLIVATSSSELA
jgi:hypothetical protein